MVNKDDEEGFHFYCETPHVTHFKTDLKQQPKTIIVYFFGMISFVNFFNRAI
jgi:hypothetical protein